jgi:peptidoglycan hydrolase CwlO-like protein
VERLLPVELPIDKLFKFEEVIKMRKHRIISTCSLLVTSLVLIVFAVGTIVTGSYHRLAATSQQENTAISKASSNIDKEIDELDARINAMEQNVYKLQLSLEQKNKHTN